MKALQTAVFSAAMALLVPACDKGISFKQAPPDHVLNLDGMNEAEQQEAERLLREAIDEAFAGAPKDMTHTERMHRLNWWVHTHLHLSNVEPPATLLKILRERRGACGATSYVFLEMARRMGYKGRARGIFCVPIQGSHVVTEIWYENAWHFFDPTFGVFFTSDAQVYSPVASWNDLAAIPNFGTRNVFYPRAKGRLGWYYPVEEYKPSSESYTRVQPEYQSKLGSYADFSGNDCGSVPYESGNKIELPMTWNLAGKSRYALGAVDGSYTDIVYQKNERGVFDATSQYLLGDSSSSLGPLFVRHRYTIRGLQRDERWRLRFYKLEGASLREIDFKVWGGRIDEISYDGDRMDVHLTARAREMQIQSWSVDEKTVTFDAVTFEREH